MLIKRIFDILLSGGAILILSPLLIVLGLFNWCILGWPIIFIQIRPGYKEKPFAMYKFRSMRQVKNAKGEDLPDAIRLTPYGHFLRKTSLDELPELINVLIGNMSLVGPRPLLMEYLPLYSKEETLRHEVLPGITGWAQVNGRNTIVWKEKLRLDVWYVRNRSFMLDLKILLLTLYKVISREGISQTGHVTSEKYTGK